MLNLAQLMRKDLRVVVHVGVLGFADRHRENLVVGFAVVHHRENADRTRDHEAAAERGFGNENQHVERIAVERQGARREPVIAGVIHR